METIIQPVARPVTRSGAYERLALVYGLGAGGMLVVRANHLDPEQVARKVGAPSARILRGLTLTPAEFTDLARYAVRPEQAAQVVDLDA